MGKLIVECLFFAIHFYAKKNIKILFGTHGMFKSKYKGIYSYF